MSEEGRRRKEKEEEGRRRNGTYIQLPVGQASSFKKEVGWLKLVVL